jgi:hypothetical protein
VRLPAEDMLEDLTTGDHKTDLADMHGEMYTDSAARVTSDRSANDFIYNAESSQILKRRRSPVCEIPIFVYRSYNSEPVDDLI